MIGGVIAVVALLAFFATISPFAVLAVLIGVYIYVTTDGD